LADRIEDVSISDEEAGEHWQMLTDVWLSGRGIEIASQRIGLSLRGINNWWTPSNKRCEMKKYCFKCCGGRGKHVMFHVACWHACSCLMCCMSGHVDMVTCILKPWVQSLTLNSKINQYSLN
jgi:hypothetical protein